MPPSYNILLLFLWFWIISQEYLNELCSIMSLEKNPLVFLTFSGCEFQGKIFVGERYGGGYFLYLFILMVKQNASKAFISSHIVLYLFTPPWNLTSRHSAIVTHRENMQRGFTKTNMLICIDHCLIHDPH